MWQTPAGNQVLITTHWVTRPLSIKSLPQVDEYSGLSDHRPARFRNWSGWRRIRFRTIRCRSCVQFIWCIKNIGLTSSVWTIQEIGWHISSPKKEKRSWREPYSTVKSEFSCTFACGSSCGASISASKVSNSCPNSPVAGSISGSRFSLTVLNFVNFLGTICVIVTLHRK